MQKVNHFHRSMAILQMVGELMRKGISQQMALMQVPQYRSRGKSGKQPHKTGHKHMAYVRAQRKK